MGLKEEEILEKMTRLLEQGCTMLATHHSCGAPLFRCKGKFVCPVCSFEGQAKPEISEPPEGASEEGLDYARKKRSQEMEARASGMEAPASGMEAPASGMEAPASGMEDGLLRPDDEELSRRKRELENALATILLRRLREFSQRIDQEEDPEDLRRVLECMDSLLRVLRSLERYN
jgi:UPF0148 protein